MFLCVVRENSALFRMNFNNKIYENYSLCIIVLHIADRDVRYNLRHELGFLDQPFCFLVVMLPYAPRREVLRGRH